MNNQVSGLFSYTLKKCANWFLYIFLDANSEATPALRAKRASQIKLLQLLDKWNGVYSYNELVAIVGEGIVERYGMTGAQVLQGMYKTVTGKSIGSIGSDYLATPTATITVPKIDVSAITTKGAADLKNIAVTNSETGGTVNFWNDAKNVIEWIVEMLGDLGVTSTKSTFTGTTPSTGDWGVPSSSFSLSSVAPYLIGAGLLYYLYTQNQSTTTKNTNN